MLNVLNSIINKAYPYENISQNFVPTYIKLNKQIFFIFFFYI